jgi:hypothetical protein
VFLNLLGAAEGALIRAAASTQPLYRFLNMPKLPIVILALLLCGWMILAQTPSPTPSIPIVQFCDLVRDAANYDGRPVRVRAVYFSAFEISGFGEPAGRSCHENSMVWVDFDPSVESNSKPEIYKRFLASIYALRVDANGNIEGEGLLWETPVVVTGVIHKPNGRGYGHTNIYSHKFVVSSVEEVGEPKKTKP